MFQCHNSSKTLETIKIQNSPQPLGQSSEQKAKAHSSLLQISVVDSYILFDTIKEQYLERVWPLDISKVMKEWVSAI